MKGPMDHSDRLAALAEGARVDRPPVSLWRHFYKDEDDLDRYVEAMVGWQRRYDWDFMKVNPRASYHYEPWGVVMKPSPDRATKPQRVGFPVQQPLDWLKITQIPSSHRMFDFQLRAVSRIRREIKQPFRIAMTVFNPISILGDMIPREELLLSTLHEQPDLLHSALRAVTATFVSLVHEFRNAGADGLFFATTQWASADRLTAEELRQFVIPYDREVWDAAGRDAFNILHVCDRNILLTEYKAFPADLTNWDVTLPGNPTLLEGHKILSRPVLGGIRHETDLLSHSPEEIHRHVRRLVDAHHDIPYSVGPGCAIPVNTPDENVAAVRTAIDSVE
jgi:uroporphyrinogen decarboxylase